MELILHLHRELLLVNQQLSSGQQLALEQLTEICQNANGAISIDSKPYFAGDWALIDSSIATSSYKLSNGGFEFESEEKIRIDIPYNFPLDPPVARFMHKRFAGFPHVLWGHGICLYLSPDFDWNPLDGMFGFIERLDLWLKAAASNQLDSVDAPLHPPVIYELNYNFEFIIQSSTPDLDSNSDFWSGFAYLKPRYNFSPENSSRHNVFELVGWSKRSDEVPKGLLASPAILFNFQFPFEYPETIHDFLNQFKQHNIELVHFINLLRQQTQRSIEADEIFLIIGTPMRRNVITNLPVQHLMVWRISKENLQKVVSSSLSLNIQIQD